MGITKIRVTIPGNVSGAMEVLQFIRCKCPDVSGNAFHDYGSTPQPFQSRELNAGYLNLISAFWTEAFNGKESF